MSNLLVRFRRMVDQNVDRFRARLRGQIAEQIGGQLLGILAITLLGDGVTIWKFDRIIPPFLYLPISTRARSDYVGR